MWMGKQRRDNQSIDSLRTDALLVFAQMSLLKLLSIMILCFIDFLDSPIILYFYLKKFFPEIQGIIFLILWSFLTKIYKLSFIKSTFLVSFN